ncbi:ATP-binding cassette domain-containing protein [Brevibacterium album]|uniref:ATP-binding cassette domain-containing protein n=1 Tax=Brevibacterium album TaxID=417948 RepID=UPI000425CA30|nr:ATP-binding cassette domain-containing protein [Brevibacterium album]
MRVTTHALGHAFDGLPSLFEGLSTTMEPGHVYALTGPSGSGKSTLLGILAGWIQPAMGSVRREGVEKVGWIFQNPHGVARRTALDHVSYAYLVEGVPRAEAEERGLTLLERFGLLESRAKQFRALSGGEAQRLMLARGIATSPDLLLVDEPTAQLDLRTAATASEALGKIATAGTIIVVATHDQRTKDACTDVIDLSAFNAAGVAA